jgi:hypothetical protein
VVRNFYFFVQLASSVQPEEFRLRAHHIFWKKQEANTDREIHFGRGVAAKILGKYQLLRDESRANYVSQIGTGISAQLGRPEIRYYSEFSIQKRLMPLLLLEVIFLSQREPLS